MDAKPSATGAVRVAAVADVHCNRATLAAARELFARASESADVLLLCGDLTEKGQLDEAQALATAFGAAARVPVLGVLGNHDFETGHQDRIRQILRDAGIAMLDGEAHEVRGIGFVGVKGFGGGFGRHQLEAWGEESIKRFVQEAVDEAMKLELALARLEDVRRVVLMHYAPIAATVEGEPAEIFPFLGSSRLEGPVNWFDVAAVFHGHAHHGALEGRTARGIPVYNVSAPALRRAYPDRPPFRIVEIPPG